MKISKGRLFGLIALIVLAAFALSACAAQDIAAVAGQAAGGIAKAGGLSGLFRTDPDKLSPEEREKYVQERNILSYTGTLNQISQVVDEVISTQREVLRITEWRRRVADKWIYVDPAANTDGETFVLIEIATYDQAPGEVVLQIRSGDEGSPSPSGVLARKLKVLIDSALRARKIALRG